MSSKLPAAEDDGPQPPNRKIGHASVYPRAIRGAYGPVDLHAIAANSERNVQEGLNTINKPVHKRVLSLHSYAITIILFSALSAAIIHGTAPMSDGGLLPNSFRYLDYITAIPPLICAPMLLFSKNVGVVGNCLFILLINYGLVSLGAYLVFATNIGGYYFTWVPAIPVIETIFTIWTRQVITEIKGLRNPFDI